MPAATKGIALRRAVTYLATMHAGDAMIYTPGRCRKIGFRHMAFMTPFRTTILALFVVAGALPITATAEPQISRGIGTTSCAKIASDIKPDEGLNDPINMMLYAWVEGYVSAANVALLEYDRRHVDMSALTDVNVLHLIQEYCKAHPEKRPSDALDTYVKTTKKMRAQWKTGTVEWDE
jgi:hypothetical protein